MRPHRALPEVFTVREIADVAGVPVADVRALLDSAEHGSTASRFIGLSQAVRLVGTLRAMSQGAVIPRALFAAPLPGYRGGDRGSLVASGALHAGCLALLTLLSGWELQSEPAPALARQPAHLVFLSSAGFGGGGGGGGAKDPRPVPPAAIEGRSRLRSPVTVTRTPDSSASRQRTETPPSSVPEPAVDPEPPPPDPQPTPPVVAPVVSAPSDTLDRPGVVTDSPGPTNPSAGSGEGGGTGTGRGTGTGEGQGAGIGDGSVAGVGGGPYRPGAGITPPALVHEVRPAYTEEGRRRGVEGEVLLEVVVRTDGGVGPVRVLRGLGSGLDQRAIEAVTQWRFSPARRQGVPVDVLVEVAVEFRIR